MYYVFVDYLKYKTEFILLHTQQKRPLGLSGVLDKMSHREEEDKMVTTPPPGVFKINHRMLHILVPVVSLESPLT